MTRGDTVRQHMATAREELIQRIALRDQALLGFLAASGASAFISPDYRPAALVLPFLSLGVAMMVAQHQEIIGSLGNYLRTEAHPFLVEIGEDAPQWDLSAALALYNHRALGHRLLAHLVILATPPLVALAANASLLSSGVVPATCWVLSAIGAGGTFLVTVDSHRWRARHSTVKQLPMR